VVRLNADRHGAAPVTGHRGPAARRRGAVLLGGVDLRHLDQTGLRRRVVLLPQDAPLPAALPAALAQALGADLGALRAALAEVGAAPPVDGWGPGGRALPPGLRQQVALAQLLVLDPDVVVLDEPTSALDPTTAATVERAAAHALAGRTVVTVAHRLATALAADRVVVLPAGRVVEHGPPAALLAAHGGFSELARAASGETQRSAGP